MTKKHLIIIDAESGMSTTYPNVSDELISLIKEFYSPVKLPDLNLRESIHNVMDESRSLHDMRLGESSEPAKLTGLRSLDRVCRCRDCGLGRMNALSGLKGDVFQVKLECADCNNTYIYTAKANDKAAYTLLYQQKAEREAIAKYVNGETNSIGLKLMIDNRTD